MDFSQLMPVINGAVGVIASIAIAATQPKPKQEVIEQKPTPAVPVPAPTAPTMPVKTIQAVIVMLSIIMGILTAAQTPGGLLALDWPTLIRTFFEAAFTVFAASQLFYEHMLKPHLNKVVSGK